MLPLAKVHGRNEVLVTNQKKLNSHSQSRFSRLAILTIANNLFSSLSIPVIKIWNGIGALCLPRNGKAAEVQGRDIERLDTLPAENTRLNGVYSMLECQSIIIWTRQNK